MPVVPVAQPESAGVDPDKLDALRARVRREVDEGLLPSCQFALARQGRLVAFEAFGGADLDTRYLMFSATKVVVASAVWHLIAAGKLDVDRRVADYIPEFATNGKDVVTVEQVMLHTSGFPHAPLGPPKWFGRTDRLAQFSRWRLNWKPGTAYEYHATSAHWVLAELIERLAEQDYRGFIHDRVTAPLGLPRVLGLPLEDQTGIADLHLCGEEPSPDELEAVFGVRELPVTEVTDDVLLRLNQPEHRAVGVPGGGGITTAATMALFYQALLHNRRPDSTPPPYQAKASPSSSPNPPPDSTQPPYQATGSPSSSHSVGQLWDPAVLADATGRVRNSFPDPLLGTPANRGLGVVIAGDDGKAPLRGFGHTQSPRAFGHNGAAGQIAWADPESGLSFCYLTNGNDRHIIRQARRTIGLSSRAAVCAS